MPRFGRFNAGQDSGPPSVGDQDADWKRADFIRVIQDASRPAGWRGATRFQPDNDTQQTLPKGYPEGHEEDMQYGEIPIGPGKALRTLSGAIERIPTVTGEVLLGVREAYKKYRNIAKLPGEDVASFDRRRNLAYRNFQANEIIERRLGGKDTTLKDFQNDLTKNIDIDQQNLEKITRQGLAKIQEARNDIYKVADDWTANGKAKIQKIFDENRSKYAAAEKPPTPDTTSTPKKPIEYPDWAAKREAAQKKTDAVWAERKAAQDKVYAEAEAKKNNAQKARDDYRIKQADRRHAEWLSDQAEKQRLENRSLFEKLRDTFK